MNPLFKAGDIVKVDWDNSQAYVVVSTVANKGKDCPDGLAYQVRGKVSNETSWTNAPAMKGWQEAAMNESGLSEDEAPIDSAHKNLASRMALEILKPYGEPKIENGNYVYSSKSAYLRLSVEDAYFAKGCAFNGIPCGCAIDFWDSKEQRGQGCIYTYKDLSEERLAKMLCGLVEELGYKKAGWEQLSLF